MKEQVERLIESVRGCESGEERVVHYRALIEILRYNEYPKVITNRPDQEILIPDWLIISHAT